MHLFFSKSKNLRGSFFVVEIIYFIFAYSEALNLAESQIPAVKRERDVSTDYHDTEHDVAQPPVKRTSSSEKPSTSQYQQPPRQQQRGHERLNSSTNESHDEYSDNNSINEHDEARRIPTSRQNSMPSSTFTPNSILSGMQFKITSRGKSI